jgi:2-hydroxychromene-2-carboxylate isomerase
MDTESRRPPVLAASSSSFGHAGLFSRSVLENALLDLADQVIGDPLEPRHELLVALVLGDRERVLVAGDLRIFPEPERLDADLRRRHELRVRAAGKAPAPPPRPSRLELDLRPALRFAHGSPYQERGYNVRMAEPVVFAFDYISPYAYIGWTQIHALAEKYGRDVVPMPVVFGALLKHGDMKGPAEVPAKRAYLGKDTLRTAKVLGIPLLPPPSHPFNPLLALRLTSVEMPAGERRKVIDALFRATWGGGVGCETAEAIGAALAAAGIPGAPLLAAATDDAAKAALRAATERAIALGVFGVPTAIAGGEIFWGYDSFGHLARMLAGDDPLRPGDLDAWAKVTPSVVRRM